MGTLAGHVLPGLVFLFTGLWHLFNHSKLHSLNPKTYTALPWFPTSRHKHLELITIITLSSLFIVFELFVGPARHQPLDDDWTIPSNHLHNVEHANIALALLTYASLAIILDKAKPQLDPDVKAGLTYMTAALVFVLEWLLFHLHSTDHMGVEGQYHWLLQLVILVSLSTAVIGVWRSKSFLVSFVRSVSIAFQGVWNIAMGIALWTPGLIPKGCFINFEEGHYVVRCKDEGSLERAKSLVNIMFSWFLVGMVVSSLSFYLVVASWYGTSKGREYVCLVKNDNDEELEKKKVDDSNGFVSNGKGLKVFELGM